VTRKRRRLYVLLAGMACLGVATTLIFLALGGGAVAFFRTPTELVTQPVRPDQRLRLGGLVEAGSVVRSGITIAFKVTDGQNTIPVTYTGVLPDLFREGQGVVAEGNVRDGVFHAATVLAKHDETYMPPEVADALKRSGHWQPGAQVKR
jgi:cytochrome c-type biogenesis protein CcmE